MRAGGDDDVSGVGPVSRPGLREEVTVFAACTAAAAMLVQIGSRLPGLQPHAVTAAEIVFLLVPWWRLDRSGEDLADYGWRLDDAGRHLAVAALLMLVLFPPFVAAWEWWWSPPHPFLPDRLPGDFWTMALAQFTVVAFPEEFLFRGFLQTRLERRFPSRDLRGIPLGPAIPLTSLLFAICHFAVIPDPARLAVFFPSLVFGWLRHRTGSLLAPIVFHGACNVLGDVLYFGHMT
jgi:hypothetical protein